MILLTSYFDSKNTARNAELVECYRRNSECAAFSEIHVMLEDAATAGCGSLKAYPPFKTVKHWLVPVTARMTYQNYFQYANNTFPAGTAVCVANADIWFDETLNLVEYIDMKQRMLCLTRWEWFPTIKQPFVREGMNSQDAWIFKTPLPPVDADFTLGLWACDNHIAFNTEKAGMRLANPCLDIKAYHYHESRVRKYVPVDNIPGELRFVEQVHVADMLVPPVQLG